MVWLARTKDVDPIYPIATLHELVFSWEKYKLLLSSSHQLFLSSVELWVSWRNMNPLGDILYFRYSNNLIPIPDFCIRNIIRNILKTFDVSLLPKEHHQHYWKLVQVNNICLKTDTILPQYTFYQFQYFITTCLHGQNLSTKVSVKKF